MASALHIVKQFFPKVRAVNDAKKGLAIRVTDGDTKSSKVRNHNECAMAVACKRKFNLDGVIISIHRAYLVKGDIATRYDLPSSVQREIVSFDRDGGFRPGQYQLSKIPKTMEQGAYRGESRSSNKHSHNGNLKKRFRHVTDGIRTVIGSKHSEGISRA